MDVKHKSPEEIHQYATKLVYDIVVCSLITLFFAVLLGKFGGMSDTTLGKVFLFVDATIIAVLVVVFYLDQKARRLKRQREDARRFQRLLEDTTDEQFDWCMIPTAAKTKSTTE